MPGSGWLKRYTLSNIAHVLSNMAGTARRDLALVTPSASIDQKREAIEYL